MAAAVYGVVRIWQIDCRPADAAGRISPSIARIRIRRGWFATVQIDTTPAPAGRAGKPALQALPAGCSTPRPPAGGTASCATMSSLSVAVVDPYTVARTALPLLL